MRRFLFALTTDVRVQLRNNLYTIGIMVALICALLMAKVFQPEQLVYGVPTMLLLVAGGTTLLYVAGMILFEKDEGTLAALVVSPLKPTEYLWSKIVSLTLLMTIESLVMMGGAMALMKFSGAEVALSQLALALPGVVLLGIFHTLVGIVMIVRYDTITSFLVPMIFVAVFLQLPALYFLGIFESPLLLLIPTGAPTMIVRAGFTGLEAWEWGYGLAYTAVAIAGLSFWAQGAFEKHIIKRIG
jgi:fluoroquinolone transport system permease protein